MSAERPRDYLSRLPDAIRLSRRALGRARRIRRELIAQYVGKHYGAENHPTPIDRVPVNLVELYVTVVSRYLLPNQTRALVVTRHERLRDVAAQFEIALNFLLQQINLQRTLATAVMDALFAIGIVKTGVSWKQDTDLYGREVHPNQPFADPVNFDNWVHDVRASCWSECTFMGDRYRMAIEDIRNRPDFDSAVAARVVSLYESSSREDDGLPGEGRGAGVNDDYGLFDYAYLYDIYVPRYRKIITVPEEHTDLNRPLLVRDWSGRPSGPYRLLFFNEVPGSVIPSGPLANVLDLHLLVNTLYNKAARQAAAAKTILGVQGGAEADAERIIHAADGSVVRIDNPDRARPFTLNTFDGPMAAFAIQAKELFSYLSGNLDLLGGLSPQAETLGQERMLSNSASKRMQAMQQITENFSAEVIRDLGYYLWTDPLVEMPLTRPIPGWEEEEIPFVWTSELRQGEYYDYHVRVVPFNQQEKTPSERAAAILQIFNQQIMPLAPLLAQQGVTVKLDALLRKLAKLLNLPELNELLSFAFRPPADQQPAVEPTLKPNVTTRRYERINRPGVSSRQRDFAAQQLLSGRNLQPAENTLGRMGQ